MKPNAITASASQTQQQTLQWRQSRPLLGDWRISRQFIFVIVASLAIMQILIAVMGLIVNGELILLPWRFVAIVAAIFTGLMLFAAVVVMGNRVVTDVTADRRGFSSVLRGGAGFWNWAVIILGTIAGKPGNVSAGLLAESRRRECHRWSHVREYYCDEGTHLISLRFRDGSWFDLQPTPHQWSAVLGLIAQGQPRSHGKPH